MLRTRLIVGAEIIHERELYLQADEDGDPIHAAEHEQNMNRLVEEYAHLPVQRLPSDRDGHQPPQAVR